MKKLIALLLVLATALSLFAGCGALFGKKETKKKGGTLTIGLPSNAMVSDYKNNDLTKWLEKETGYTLEFQVFSGSEAVTQITTMAVGDETLPDIIFGIPMDEGTIRKFGKDGYFQDLTKFFADKDGASKTFWTRLEENYTKDQQEDIKRKLVDSSTGAYYYVPTMETSLVDYIDYQMWINQTWLDKLGLPMPTDIDSLYNTLVAFKERDPNGNGKKDEIPLFGSQETSMGGDVINWIINMFIYMNDRRTFNLTKNDEIYVPFTTDEYREALKFLNKLYKEGLINSTFYSTKNDAMPAMVTPASGTAMVGIFAGHLTLHTSLNSPVLEQYVSLPLWSPSVINDANFSRSIFITRDCKAPEKAFDLIMTMWSEEASYRFRYGVEGVNWEYAPKGSVSDYGLPATIKILNDPLGSQNTCMWSGACGGLNVYAEGEAALYDGETNPWLAMRAAMAAESRKNSDAANEKYVDGKIKVCPTLVFTPEEASEIEAQRSGCDKYYKSSRTDFIKGTMNPNSDSDWNAYLKELNKLGLEDWIAVAQKAYNRATL